MLGARLVGLYEAANLDSRAPPEQARRISSATSAAMIRKHENLQARRIGAAGRLTLDRPASLNALTLGMVRGMAEILDKWEADPEIGAVVIDAARPRAFCAGGDIRALHDGGRAKDGLAETFWREEYILDARIAGYSKPVVPLMAGLIMGGGVGISAHARHRVVTDTTALAMPEVGIGLIPDVGATWLLSRAPGECGTYLALTGERIGAADVIALGLADHFVPQARLEELGAALAAISGPDLDRGVSEAIGRVAGAPGPSRLLDMREKIDALFRFDTVEEIVAALDRDGSDWARGLAAGIATRSPTSLKLTLAALRGARSLASLEASLQVEYRIVCRIIRAHDFLEGVRAIIIDKDQKPHWSPATLPEVTPEMVAAYFEPLGPDELTF
jgi:enoyl-CoA hydratase